MRKIKRRVIISILIIVISIIAISCKKEEAKPIVLNPEPIAPVPNETKVPVNLTNQTIAVEPLKNDTGVKAMFETNERLKACESLKGEMYQAWCFKDLARNDKNPELCEKVTHSLEKDGCYKELSILLNDLTLCEKVRYNLYRDQCYAAIASSLKNSTLCEKVKISHMRDECKSASVK